MPNAGQNMRWFDLKDSTIDFLVSAGIILSVVFVCAVGALVLVSSNAERSYSLGGDSTVSCGVVLDSSIDCEESYSFEPPPMKTTVLVYCETGKIYYCYTPMD